MTDYTASNSEEMTRTEIDNEMMDQINGGLAGNVLPSLLDDDGIVSIDAAELIKRIKTSGGSYTEVHKYQTTDPAENKNFIAKHFC